MVNKWREIQLKSISNIGYLCKFLELDEKNKAFLLSKSKFPLNIPLRLAQKIKKNCLNDPIFLQYVPLISEKIQSPEYFLDPVQDQTFQNSPKLLKKYKQRALLLCSSACVMHCRYCFRKNYPYETNTKGFDKEIELIQNDDSLREIILSGGDPLSLSNNVLEKLLQDLNKISHITRLRFHSRFPIGIPERIDDDFLNILKKINKQIFFILHVNHPLEIDEDVIQFVKNLQALRIPILTQTVLLKGVNDSLPILKQLSEKLIDNGIIPYYLHQLDPVQGAQHFEVKKERGMELIEQLRAEVSGYGIFQYVQEIPHKTSKTPILK